MLNKKLTEFFLNYPDAAVVFVALGVLFTDLEKAHKYLAGVSGKTVETFTREQVTAATPEELDLKVKEAEAEAEAKLKKDQESQALNAADNKDVADAMDGQHTAGFIDEVNRLIATDEDELAIKELQLSNAADEDKPEIKERIEDLQKNIAQLKASIS